MDIFYALSDPTRRNILEIIAEGGKLAASDISAHFKISAAAVSQHLKVLKEANLVKMEKKAQQRIYTINPEAMLELEDWLKNMVDVYNKRFSAMDRLLEEAKKK